MKKVKLLLLGVLISTNILILASCMGPVNVPEEEVKQNEQSNDESIYKKVDEIVDSEKIAEKIDEIKRKINEKYGESTERKEDIDNIKKSLQDIENSANGLESSIDKEKLEKSKRIINDTLDSLYNQLTDVNIDKEKMQEKLGEAVDGIGKYVDEIKDSLKSLLGL